MIRKKKRKRKIGIFILIVLMMVGASFFGLRSVFPRPYHVDVNELSQTYQLDPSLIYAVIHTESGFRADAISPAGAKGLMQITEETGEFISKKLNLLGYTKDDLFKPKTNIQMGTYYLSYLRERFMDQRTMLAAYNAGPNRVAKWLEDETLSDGKTLKVIPYEETSTYVERVMFRKRIYELIYWFD